MKQLIWIKTANMRLGEMGSTAADWWMREAWNLIDEREIPNDMISEAMQKSGLILNKSANHASYFIRGNLMGKIVHLVFWPHPTVMQVWDDRKKENSTIDGTNT